MDRKLTIQEIDTRYIKFQEIKAREKIRLKVIEDELKYLRRKRREHLFSFPYTSMRGLRTWRQMLKLWGDDK